MARRPLSSTDVSMRVFTTATFLSAFGLFACGGVREIHRDQTDAGIEAGAVPSGAAPCAGACPDTEGRAEALPRPVCPSTAPLGGAPCTENGLRCSYGDDPYPYCRSELECRGETWTEIAARAAYCDVPIDGRCPAERPKSGSACTVDALGTVPCAYEAVSCRCGAGLLANPGDKGSWLCFGAPENLGCPALLPNLGEGCAANGTECWYDPEGCLDSRLYLICQDGAWTGTHGPRCFQ
jgi:hypothetical protein